MTNEERSERAQRAMEEYLANDQAKVKPPAGWYPHPNMVDTVRYWDGQRWTDSIAPAGSGRQGELQTSSAATMRVDPTYAWVLALTPVAMAALAFLSPAATALSLAGLVVAGVAVGLAYFDAKRYEAVGLSLDWPWAFLAGGAYLIHRTRRVGSTPALPVVWFLGLAIAVLGAFTFAETVVIDEDQLESDLETHLSDNNMLGEVDCPGDLAGHVGDSMICDVFGNSYADTVKVTVEEDGYYRFEFS